MPVAVVLGDGPKPWVERVAPVPVTPARAIAILGYHDPDELDDLGGQLAVNRAGRPVRGRRRGDPPRWPER